MRVGSNPNNKSRLEGESAFHRVIIPIYIPHETGYFEQAFDIFTMCLLSLHRTSRTRLLVAVVANGCSEAISDRLRELQKDGWIDELTVVKEGIGKINSVLRSLRTASEPFITITDADVLFDVGWEDAVFDVFRSFPQAGAVCPVPVFRKNFDLTANIWLRFLFSSRLRYEKVQDPESMTRFAKSLGWEYLLDRYKDCIATLTAANGAKALVGCSHFVATYRREVFEKLPSGNSEFRIRGNSELLYTDLPVIKRGGFRLSTVHNHAFHVGNQLEDWIVQKFETLPEITGKRNPDEQFGILPKPILSGMFLEKVFKRMLGNRRFYRWLLKQKGMTPQQITDHFTD
ncbi:MULTISPECIES: hypothetical protein [unclassified Flavobacterium]|uniref:hypothetical protein n=1 Tax=unclassified Flavobacterium TaxID=196869 RepID=UPI001F139118|nr:MULTISPECIES: hypothetical protein [unclassified Flavobacterium]UMY65725.1 hypothetical protein MKO97_14670 [Flavobacterium sp. HJ-32-4]